MPGHTTSIDLAEKHGWNSSRLREICIRFYGLNTHDKINAALTLWKEGWKTLGEMKKRVKEEPSGSSCNPKDDKNDRIDKTDDLPFDPAEWSRTMELSRHELLSIFSASPSSPPFGSEPSSGTVVFSAWHVQSVSHVQSVLHAPPVSRVPLAWPVPSRVEYVQPKSVVAQLPAAAWTDVLQTDHRRKGQYLALIASSFLEVAAPVFVVEHGDAPAAAATTVHWGALVDHEIEVPFPVQGQIQEGLAVEAAADPGWSRISCGSDASPLEDRQEE
ncbi:hypothetical protein BGW39_004760 [Mortierella sp. 14UC]|nr:hypothetical protein BGW39_004760 [Mortierella sp. 14UC]